MVNICTTIKEAAAMAITTLKVYIILLLIEAKIKVLMDQGSSP
jgi:hypothetical protein